MELEVHLPDDIGLTAYIADALERCRKTGIVPGGFRYVFDHPTVLVRICFVSADDAAVFQASLPAEKDERLPHRRVTFSSDDQHGNLSAEDFADP